MSPSSVIYQLDVVIFLRQLSQLSRRKRIEGLDGLDKPLKSEHRGHEWVNLQRDTHGFNGMYTYIYIWYIYIAYKLVYDIWPCPKTWGIPPKTASLRKWCQTRDIKWYKSWRIHDHPPWFEQRIQLFTAKNGKKLPKMAKNGEVILPNWDCPTRILVALGTAVRKYG